MDQKNIDEAIIYSNQVNKIVRKNATFYGLIMGGVSVAITFIIYFVDYHLFLNPSIGIVQLVSYLILGVLVVYTTRKKLGNAIIFKDAFTSYFLAGFIASVISVIASILLFNLIAPEIQGPLKEASLEYSLKMMDSLNLPDTERNALIEQAKNANPYTVTEFLKSLGTTLIGHAMFGALLALIFRNRQTI